MTKIEEQALSWYRHVGAEQLDDPWLQDLFSACKEHVESLHDDVACAYRIAAFDLYAQAGEFEVHDEAAVSIADDKSGAFVQMWQWISEDDVKNTR